MGVRGRGRSRTRGWLPPAPIRASPVRDSGVAPPSQVRAPQPILQSVDLPYESGARA
jgi:hypothetical protein